MQNNIYKMSLTPNKNCNDEIFKYFSKKYYVIVEKLPSRNLCKKILKTTKHGNSIKPLNILISSLPPPIICVTHKFKSRNRAYKIAIFPNLMNIRT